MRGCCSRSRRTRAGLAAGLALASALISCSPTSKKDLGPADRSRLDPQAVRTLLDAIDTIVDKNPRYMEELKALESLDAAARKRRLDEHLRANGSDPDIEGRISAFLDTPAMQIYFRRFQNVTPDDFRRALCALPYQRVELPGDIATPFHELVTRRREMRAWVDTLAARISVTRCRDRAVEWLPEGPYAVPLVSLVYDNNAGSFTAEGKAFYNLYADYVRTLPPGRHLTGVDTGEMEAVIGHELHHVFAAPFYDRAPRPAGRPEMDAAHAVIRDLVSEGTAMHCNPPQGFKKALWEDPGTLGALMGELNENLLALSLGRMTPSTFRRWYAGTFQLLPRQLLERYVVRNYPVEQRDDLISSHMPDRPDLAHALGWWMVSRISGSGANRRAVQDLVIDPYQLFRRYDAAMGSGPDSLKVDPRLIPG